MVEVEARGGLALPERPEGPADQDEPSANPMAGVAMDPDDPVLVRTQAVLKRQLTESKMRLEGELREKAKLLRDAQKNREDTGVELFNFQQQLARLQMDLEKAHENHMQIAAQKEQAQGKVEQLKSAQAEEVKLVKGERLRADKFQEELDRCSLTGCLLAPMHALLIRVRNMHRRLCSLCVHCMPLLPVNSPWHATTLREHRLRIATPSTRPCSSTIATFPPTTHRGCKWHVTTDGALRRRQAATLRQIEAYNEEMKSEIAVTRRATYKAEEAVQQLEREKARQDDLIDKLQESLKSLHQAATLRAAQVRSTTINATCQMTLFACAAAALSWSA
jgi:DNA repair exonuclease SbcCD ATPase subunit